METLDSIIEIMYKILIYIIITMSLYTIYYK